jgi:hypothetical protein
MTQKSLTQNAADNIDHMVELLHKQIENYRKLQRGLLLAELIGVAPKDIKEPLRHSVIEGGHMPRPWVGSVLRVRIGDGPDQEFPLKDVDRRLWPEAMQQAWGRWQKHLTRKEASK